MFSKIKSIMGGGDKQKKKPRKVVAEHRKNGVRKIVSDEELFDAFGISGDELTLEADLEKEISCPVKKYVKDVEENKTSFPKIVDKNGFPILDDIEDITMLMNENFEEDAEEAVDTGMGVDEGLNRRGGPGKNLKTRHGIPILQKDDDYSKIFNADESVESFNEILAESLGDKSFEVLLNEKRDKIQPVKKMTVKQRLSRYPLPQGQLDLHGYSAIKADLTVESYLKNAFRNGTYTVRIIVGKGLHSEDGPVLPDVIEKRVIQMKSEEIVFAYEWDKKKKSKSGSLTVYLNNYHKF